MKKTPPTYDRVQALVRNKQYLKDLVELHKKKVVTDVVNGTKRKRLLTCYEKEEIFCKKYNLEMVVTPAFAKKYTREQIEGLPIFCDNPVVSVKPQGKKDAKNNIINVRINGELTQVPKLDEADYVLRKKRFLNVEIDLLKNTKKIEKKLSQLVRSYKKYVTTDSTRHKTTIYDPWHIYDLHKSNGLSLLEISRQLHGGTYPRGSKTPAYNYRLWAPFKNVQRAYKQAEKMINNVTP